LLERVFHVKILCLRAVISFSFFVIAYRFYNIVDQRGCGLVFPVQYFAL
jgi:hypothetical protein